MRIVRIWLLVLLAALLPFRAAVAAGMACPNESSTMHQHVPGSAHRHHPMADHAAIGHAAHEHADSTSHHDHDGSGHADKCNLCAACCSGTALATVSAMQFHATGQAAGDFPELSSPAPSFVSGGQERPPRTI